MDKEEARYLGASVRARKEPACAFSKVFAAAPRRQSGSVAGLNCGFRSKSATDSDLKSAARFRFEAGHLFRSKPATDSDLKSATLGGGRSNSG